MLTKSNNTTYKGTLDNRYLIINEIDNGMTSKVYKVLDEQTSEIKIAKIYENDSAHAFKKEKKIFKMLQALDLSSNIKYYVAGIGERAGRGVSELIVTSSDTANTRDNLFREIGSGSTVLYRNVDFGEVLASGNRAAR